jgi:galactokinase
MDTPRVFRAPGRVNLIGEHTDYNEGFVLPVAMALATYVAGIRRSDRRIRIVTTADLAPGEIDLDAAPSPRRGNWLDYVEGMARRLEARGVRLAGTNLAVESELPPGAGLASSAALEVAVGLALLGLSDMRLSRIEIALSAQEAEHEYVGTRSGLMDPYIAMFGRRGHALLLDCRSREAQAIPFPETDAVLMVCDSGIKHELAATEYNLRREECDTALALLRESLPHLRSLRDVTPAQFAQLSWHLPDPLGRRCRHVLEENARTLEAARVLLNQDAASLGKLFDQSHASLRDLYEVSCSELDVLVELARSIPGVLGSRMTGGGFGGCTVTVMRPGAAARFEREMTRGYADATGISPRFWRVDPGDAAGELTGDVGLT